MRIGGTYFFNCANPFVAGLTFSDWDGNGYPLSQPYAEGIQTSGPDEPWVFRGDVPSEPIRPAKEYKHTLSTLINGLIAEGFVIRRVMEETLGTPDAAATPGSMDHFAAIAPLWLKFWAYYQPDPSNNMH
jgi:hypothetical protein